MTVNLLKIMFNIFTNKYVELFISFKANLQNDMLSWRIHTFQPIRVELSREAFNLFISNN